MGFDMTCDICGKKEATVHLTEIVNEQVTKLNLCEDCAREKGAEMEEHFGLSELLAGLTDMGTTVEPEIAISIKCPNCGMTYQNFRKLAVIIVLLRLQFYNQCTQNMVIIKDRNDSEIILVTKSIIKAVKEI